MIVNGHSYSVNPINASVPQGSGLASTLFFLNTNDLKIIFTGSANKSFSTAKFSNNSTQAIKQEKPLSQNKHKTNHSFKFSDYKIGIGKTHLFLGLPKPISYLKHSLFLYQKLISY